MQSVLIHLLLLLVLMQPLTAAEESDSHPIILLLLGPPGSGRDVLAVKVSSTFSFPYISTADLLLDSSDDEGETGKLTRDCLNSGRIPDELLLRLIAERVAKADCTRGFLLDGFPKTIEQAQALKNKFGVKYNILPMHIRTSDEWLINFHEGRLVCTNCGRVYHLDRSPPQNEEICDLCGYGLIQRNDDCPETLKQRSCCYRNKIKPVLTYYSQEERLVEIDGNRPLEEMLQETKLLINSQHR